MFEGSMNEAKNRIEGNLSKKDDKNDEKTHFSMTLRDEFYSCEIQIGH